MITHNSNEVRIIAGDHQLREATIALPDGRVRVVSLHRLKGTRGGMMEVMVHWEAACRKSEALEKERTSNALREAGAPRRGDVRFL